MNLDDVLVFNFATEERTIALSELCIKKLGFKNLVTIHSSDGFRSKFLTFCEMAAASDKRCFLRSDADRLLFDGTLDLVKAYESDPNLDCVEGYCFDFLMNRHRGATPHLFSRRAIEALNDNPQLMPDSQKPESRFIEKITKNKKSGWKIIDAVTNLHDYEQKPSKVCNTILNRIFRNHFQNLYDINYLSTLHPKYWEAVLKAMITSKEINSKNTMDYLDFSYLDVGFPDIEETELESLYEKYRKTYNEKCH